MSGRLRGLEFFFEKTQKNVLTNTENCVIIITELRNSTEHKEGTDMAVLSKEAYEGKREWAARKHARTAEMCETLTQEQHEALAWLCDKRHFWHINADRHLFNVESATGSELLGLIFDGEGGRNGKINERLASVGLPTIDFGYNIEDIPDDYTWEYTYESMEEAFDECAEVASDINSKIEGYLHQIDEEHGTDYEPTGATRIY